jgi:hypothetical protein
MVLLLQPSMARMTMVSYIRCERLSSCVAGNCAGVDVSFTGRPEPRS